MKTHPSGAAEARTGVTRAAAMAAIAAMGALLVLLIFAGCSSAGAARKPSAAEAAASAPVATSNAQLPRFRIKDWSAPNDRMVIVVADDGTRYRAETLGPCTGLNFANRLAFVNRGGFEQVDRYSSVVLGDGTRCALQSFDKLQAPEAKALDSYEKSGEAKPADGAEPAKDKAAGEGTTEPK